MQKPIILCIDDERIILECLKTELQDHFSKEFSIEATDSGEKALELVNKWLSENREVLMIISDQLMPGLKGDELLVKIHRFSPVTKNCILSGYIDVEAIRNAVNNAELFRYFSKPWETDELVSSVKEAARRFEYDKKFYSAV